MEFQEQLFEFETVEWDKPFKITRDPSSRARIYEKRGDWGSS